MKLQQIITTRNYNNWPSWDLVFEWEDIIKSKLQLDFYYDRKLMNNRYIKKIPFFNNLLQTNKFSFLFEMSVGRSNNRNNKKNIVPCIIDFFLTKEQLPSFYKRYDKNSIVLVSSKEVYDFLKSVDCPINIGHFPLSISDVYRISEDTAFDKKYDLVIMGRTNPVLLEFMNKYSATHPHFRYVYRVLKDGVFNYYTSDGEMLGDICTREKYIQLMRSAKVGFYSTPGIDGGEKRTNGFNQVTPRFLELVASQCHIISRYPKNSDTDYYNLSRFGKSVETYEEFCAIMDGCLSKPVDLKFYSEYLQRHYTSIRAEQLSEIIKSI